MNTRRAANRERSRRDAARNPETHMEMRGRPIPTREPDQSEANYRPVHEPHFSHRSPASIGSSKGPGPLGGAGELPARGAGTAQKNFIGRDAMTTPERPTPSGKTPAGMKTYAEE